MQVRGGEKESGWPKVPTWRRRSLVFWAPSKCQVKHHGSHVESQKKDEMVLTIRFNIILESTCIWLRMRFEKAFRSTRVKHKDSLLDSGDSGGGGDRFFGSCISHARSPLTHLTTLIRWTFSRTGQVLA